MSQFAHLSVQTSPNHHNNKWDDETDFSISKATAAIVWTSGCSVEKNKFTGDHGVSKIVALIYIQDTKSWLKSRDNHKVVPKRMLKSFLDLACLAFKR